MQKITPFLWFANQAEEAMNYYVSTFKNAPHDRGSSRILSITRYEKGMEAPGADKLIGKVLTGSFELAGQRFMALDGGPIFKFNEAVSFYIECADQEEVDYFTDKLSAIPESEICGWVKDKYGVSWQIIPKRMGELMSDSDPKKVQATVNAMLKMKKIIIADLEKAHDAA
jgi:predicted 3-demethylubiquinone-9 3-methyltransferase (glyoxalase superfamily)